MFLTQNNLLIIAYDLKGVTNGWLMPNGQLVIDHLNAETFSSFHNELAQHVIMDHFKLKDTLEAMDYCDDVLNVSYATDYLEDGHWIRLHGFPGCEPEWIVNNIKPTSGQTETMLDWCIVNLKNYEKVVLFI